MALEQKKPSYVFQAAPKKQKAKKVEEDSKEPKLKNPDGKTLLRHDAIDENLKRVEEKRLKGEAQLQKKLAELQQENQGREPR